MKKKLKLEGIKLQEKVCKLYVATREFFGIGIVDKDEKKAIEEHKYYLSEKAGHDVGWKFAYDDWKKNYSKEWRQERKRKYS